MTPNTNLAKGNKLFLQVFFKQNTYFPFKATKGGNSFGQVYPILAVILCYSISDSYPSSDPR